MKKTLMIIAIFWMACDDPAEPNPNQVEWEAHPDFMNLIILKVDYQTHQFEGANFTKYTLCEFCDYVSLPFDFTYEQPGDLGESVFTYSETGDTLFYATTVWDGQGEILYPVEFSPPEFFQMAETPVSKPDDYEYFSSGYSYPGENNLDSLTGSIWESVSTLQMVHEFTAALVKVGFYLYAPSVGGFDPDSAMWVIFLYRGNPTPAGDWDLEDLYKTWLHSYEEQKSTLPLVYRPFGFMNFPPVWFRMVYIFNEDGTCDYLVHSPDDAPFLVPGTWELATEDEPTVFIFDDDGQLLPDKSFVIVDLRSDRLLTKPVD